MDVTYGEISTAGPVRPHNEDTVLFWQPADEEERRVRGAVAIIADGVGGQGHGEVASKLAAETALKNFKDAEPGMPLNGLIWQMFNMANLAVYDEGMKARSDEGRMATTMTITVFRNNEVGIGHVGDSRSYLVQGGKIRCMTGDHTHLAFHVKMGLFSAAEAQNSPLRSVLTRAVGKEPTVNADFFYSVVYPGDFIIQCCDGVHVYITDREMMELATRKTPAESCKDLLTLATSRGTDDNISVQICRIDKVHQLTFYRGNPVYTKPAETTAAEGELGVKQVLDKRFEITRLISRSGMASIFEALDLTTGQDVAIKVPFMQFESDPAFYSRFEREEAIGRTLKHPSILHVLPVEKDSKSRPYIVMELLDGETLDQVMSRERPMDVDKALRITREMCAALVYMHSQNIVHRDMKPQNIMLCKDGSLRIMDFGIAKAASMRRITFTGFSPAMGTPDYMAPEQVKGKRGDERTDIYSLGAMFYEMATGSVPFEGQNPFLIMNARVTGDPKAPRRLNSKISPQVEEIILHAMAREPAQRYQSAAEFKKELEQPQQVQVTGRVERLQVPAQWKSKWRAMRITIIGVVIVAGVSCLFLLLAHGGPKHH